LLFGAWRLVMMKTLAFVMFTVAVGLFAGCGGDAANVRSNAEMANKIEKAVAAAPTRGLLVGLETKAFEAWKNNDAAFWDEYLDSKFVSYTGGVRYDKAGEIKQITETKCEVTSYTLSDEKMTPIGTDAIVLTTKVAVDGKCGGQQIPSPVISTTLYVRYADTWKAAYHNEVPVLDPKAPKSAAPKKAPVKASEPRTDDKSAAELLAIEKKGWDAWKARDRAALEPIVTEDLTLVDVTGTVTIGKNAVLDAWLLPKCDIKAAVPSDAAATMLSRTVAILTYKGTAAGKCDGKPLGSLWGTSIFQKEAGEWKVAYVFETPAS